MYYNANDSESEKRTKSVTAYVTKIEKQNIDGEDKTIAFCEYSDGESRYVFQSIAVPYSLQLSVGAPVEVLVDPDNMLNYYVAINEYINIEESYQHVANKRFKLELLPEELSGVSEERKPIVLGTFIGAVALITLISFLDLNDYINSLTITILTAITLIGYWKILPRVLGINKEEMKKRVKETGKIRIQFYNKKVLPGLRITAIVVLGIGLFFVSETYQFISNAMILCLVFGGILYLLLKNMDR